MASLQTLPGVDPHVVFQLLFLGEDDLTNRTGSPLLPCVGPLVTVAGALVTEGHLTKLTLVWLDTQVDSYVSLQITLLDKLLRTVGTFVSWTCNIVLYV